MKSADQNFEIEKSHFFHRKFHWKLYENEKFRDRKISIFQIKKNNNWIFNENFDEHFRDFLDLEIAVGRFHNALTFFIINRFGRDFFQSCVDFHGGDAES